MPELSARLKGLSPLEWGIVVEIEKNGKVTQKELGEILNVPRRSVQRAMHRLSEIGVICRKNKQGWLVMNAED